MVKNSIRYICTECGWGSAKWIGRCGGCKSWGTVAAQPVSASGGGPAAPGTPARAITEISAQASTKTPTGVGELDRALGGGTVPGMVILLAGEPGIGKSTLLLDVAAKAAKTGGGASVLYISGEESAPQVRARAERIGALENRLLLASESSLPAVLGHLNAVHPDLAVIDSVQTVSDPQTEGTTGGVAQVRAVTAALVNYAKTSAVPLILVGHVTKEGAIAGPRTLEHLVDTVCQFEGDRHSQLRMIRAVKNRFGPTDEIGCFEMGESGIRELSDPSGVFLSARSSSVPGTCVTVTLEGRRPMPVEVQALIVPAAGPPKRTTSGLDFSRVSMMLAVIRSRLGIACEKNDVFVSTVGGAKTPEPAADLAVSLALASAAADLPVAPGTVALGEVSLTGELRPIAGLQRRLNEAARLGFTAAVIPAQSETVKVPPKMVLKPVADLNGAAKAALCTT